MKRDLQQNLRLTIGPNMAAARLSLGPDFLSVFICVHLWFQPLRFDGGLRFGGGQP
jgi:hypothetical protein